MNEDRLCRNMFVHLGCKLTLCAAVLGAGFYCWQKAGEVGVEEKKKVLVYEVGWPDEKDGRAVFRKERYYLDEKMGQPRKVEKYFRYEPDGEYILEETRIIDYSKGKEAGAGKRPRHSDGGANR